jgi:hypothetical protein
MGSGADSRSSNQGPCPDVTQPCALFLWRRGLGRRGLGRLRLGLVGLHSRENRAGCGSSRDEDRQRDRRHHKNDSRPGCCLGQRRGCSPRPESCLTAHAPERGSDVSAFSALQQHHNDQKQANNNVNDGNEYDHSVKSGSESAGFVSSRNSQMMVRKGGFEPPRLSAPPPQDGVSASSTTSAH